MNKDGQFAQSLLTRADSGNAMLYTLMLNNSASLKKKFLKCFK